MLKSSPVGNHFSIGTGKLVTSTSSPPRGTMLRAVRHSDSTLRFGDEHDCSLDTDAVLLKKLFTIRMSASNTDSSNMKDLFFSEHFEDRDIIKSQDGDVCMYSLRL